jgi:hypothetical protein
MIDLASIRLLLKRSPLRETFKHPLRPSLAISEWQINQLKMQAKSVEKSMGEVD